MTITIAVAGKGGTGKTTFAGLLIRHLVQSHTGRVLAIDADPSSNLHLVLGLPLPQTVGSLREEARAGVPAGMSRQEWLDYAVRLSVEEGADFDFLAMGRPEGQGCYCAANQMLRTIMDQICSTYDYVVMDNEAGMEHLSRRTTRDVDHLLLISDGSLRGLVAAGEALALSTTLNIHVRHTYLVVNRVVGDLPAAFRTKITEMDVPLLAVAPYDPQLVEFDGNGRPLVELPRNIPISQVVEQVAGQLLGQPHPCPDPA